MGSPPDEITKAFEFLVDDFDYTLIESGVNNDFKGKHFAFYRNDNAKLQLEMSADENWFHCELRRLVNGRTMPYSDKKNNQGFESLAILESDNNYEHLSYFAGGSNGLAGVLQATAELFRRNKSILTTDSWIDSFRYLNKDPHHYTWWSQRFGNKVRLANKGWRIDYICLSPPALPHLKSAAILPDAVHSDHCPMMVEMDF